MNLDEWMTQCTADLAKAEADLQKAQQKVDELRTIQDGIRLAQQRYGQHEQAPPPSPSRTSKAAGQRTRRKTVKRVRTGYSNLCYDTLVELGGRSTTAEIREVLEAGGHDVDPDQVRNSFAYLVRKGQVMRIENGVWNVAPPDGPDFALPTSDVDPDAVPQPAL